jgi:hypothetical protein
MAGMTQPLQPATAHDIYLTARSFEVARSDVLTALNQRMGGTSGTVAPAAVHILAPGVALSALAAELFLKSLIVMEGKPVKREHRLHLLFGELSAAAQKQIKDHYNELIARPENAAFVMAFEIALESSSRAFDRFRYIHEGLPNSKDVWAGSIISDAIHWTIIDAQPSWK